jgi:AraC-like DNA-binding protein
MAPRLALTMTPAVDVQTFMTTPVGTYVVGASVVVWVQAPDRIGMFHVGAFDRSDEAALQQIFPLVTHAALAERYDLLHDIGDVSVFDEPAFQFFVAFLQQWVHALAPRVRRLAVVRPSGVAGAAFTGLFHEWVVPRFDAKLCASRDEAYDFLDVPSAARAELDAAGAREPALRRLRDILEANLTGASLEHAAGALATSPRTLQRLLAANRTSFRQELMSARMRVAQRLLLASDDKVEVIADAIGFASAPAFSTLFRRIVGETPTEFRARFRQST